jgi:hypothetical protein
MVQETPSIIERSFTLRPFRKRKEPTRKKNLTGERTSTRTFVRDEHRGAGRRAEEARLMNPAVTEQISSNS